MNSKFALEPPWALPFPGSKQGLMHAWAQLQGDRAMVHLRHFDSPGLFPHSSDSPNYSPGNSSVQEPALRPCLLHTEVRGGGEPLGEISWRPA